MQNGLPLPLFPTHFFLILRAHCVGCLLRSRSLDVFSALRPREWGEREREEKAMVCIGKAWEKVEHRRIVVSLWGGWIAWSGFQEGLWWPQHAANSRLSSLKMKQVLCKGLSWPGTKLTSDWPSALLLFCLAFPIPGSGMTTEGKFCIFIMGHLKLRANKKSTNCPKPQRWSSNFSPKNGYNSTRRTYFTDPW